MVTDHVLIEVRLMLTRSAAERILYLEKDHWIGYPRAQMALKKLKALYQHPQRQRMPNLLLIGPTNNGK